MTISWKEHRGPASASRLPVACRRLRVFLLAGSLLGAAAAQAQVQTQVTSVGAAESASGLQAGPQRQLLGAGDRIKVSVFQSPEFGAEVRLGGDGRVTLPGIGRLSLQNLDEEQAQAQIAEALVDRGLLLRPQVTVEVVQLRSREFSVLGGVQRPGRYALEVPGLRVSDAVALAGGIAAGSADTVVLKTRGPDGRAVLRPVDLPALFEVRLTTPAAARVDDLTDPVLQPGDQLWVGPAPQVYVQGLVIQPGAQPLVRGLTVRQALARTGGFLPPPEGTRRAEPELQLLRQAADGQVRPVTPSSSELLQPGDVLVAKLRP